MNKNQWDRMMRTIPGIGVTGINCHGETFFRFYEDFDNSPGIDRAMDQEYRALNRGTVKSLVFHDNHAQLRKAQGVA